ncbi:MAG: hypothetical protein P1P80_05835 [ANME-2 cluster archaeon]|nr:hypothetical protein [ANME-2 cluster archaeon]
MSLPSICPKTGSGSCTGDACTMHVMDWRSKEEYCIVGYYPNRERKSQGEPVVDNYAAGNRAKGTQNNRAAPPSNINSKLNGLTEYEEPASWLLDNDNKRNNHLAKSKKLLDMKDIPNDYEAEFWNKQ